jgi:hypothetical protein
LEGDRQRVNKILTGDKKENEKIKNGMGDS